jgi:hypothetical protein
MSKRIRKTYRPKDSADFAPHGRGGLNGDGSEHGREWGGCYDGTRGGAAPQAS